MIAVLIIALISANGMCLARCAGFDCQSTAKVPPCHEDKPVESCNYPLLVAAVDTGKFVQGLEASYPPPGPATFVALPDIQEESVFVGSSPPHSPALRFYDILRI